MILIKEDNTANAINTLQHQAQLIGEVGWWKFYILDGKAWAIDDDVVYRSDDKVETEIITQLCRELTKLIPKRIPLSDLFGPSEKSCYDPNEYRDSNYYNRLLPPIKPNIPRA